MAAEGDGGRSSSPISSPPGTGYDDFGFQRPKWQLDMGPEAMEWCYTKLKETRRVHLSLISFQEVVDSWQSSNLHQGFQNGQLVDSLNPSKWSVFGLRDTFGRIPQAPAARIPIDQAHVETYNWILGPSRNCSKSKYVLVSCDRHRCWH